LLAESLPDKTHLLYNFNDRHDDERINSKHNAKYSNFYFYAVSCRPKNRALRNNFDLWLSDVLGISP